MHAMCQVCANTEKSKNVTSLSCLGECGVGGVCCTERDPKKIWPTWVGSYDRVELHGGNKPCLGLWRLNGSLPDKDGQKCIPEGRIQHGHPSGLCAGEVFRVQSGVWWDHWGGAGGGGGERAEKTVGTDDKGPWRPGWPWRTLKAGPGISCGDLCLVAQTCLTLRDPVDCTPLGSSVRGDSPSKNPPCPPPGDLPNPGIEPRSLTLQANSLPTEQWPGY